VKFSRTLSKDDGVDGVFLLRKFAERCIRKVKELHLMFFDLAVSKVKISLLQAVEAHRVARG
jgi:hypothetical protein